MPDTNVDLSVTLAGMTMKNPVVVASGTFGFGREYGQFYDLAQLVPDLDGGVGVGEQGGTHGHGRSAGQHQLGCVLTPAHAAHAQDGDLDRLGHLPHHAHRHGQYGGAGQTAGVHL